MENNQIAAMEIDQHRGSIATSASLADDLHTNCHTLQLPPGNGAERASVVAGSLRQSRPQSIHCRPRSTAATGSFIVDIATKPQSSQKLDAIHEDEIEIIEAKREIRWMKALDVNSTRNALFLAHQAFAVGSNTLQTLQGQSDRLHMAEDNLNRAASENKDVTRKLKELKQANQIISIANPFSTAKHKRRADAEMLATRRDDREQRDGVRAAKWHAWKETHIHMFASVPLHQGATRHDVLARAKYQFEEDSDDERLEDVIEGNIDELLVVVQGLKGLAMAAGAQLNLHSQVIDRTKALVDEVDDELASNRAKLDRFH